MPLTAAPVFIQKGRTLSVTAGKYGFVFDRTSGLPVSLTVSGRELFRKAPAVTLWRAPTDNDMYTRKLWEEDFLPTARLYPESDGIEVRDRKIVYTVEGQIANKSRLPWFKVSLVYTLSENGMEIKTYAQRNVSLLTCAEDGNKKRYTDRVPRFGFAFSLDKSLNRLFYFGNGPYECYTDFCAQSMPGWWESTVEGEYRNYLRPQEQGNHTEVRYLTLSDGETVLKAESERMEFSALPYSIRDLDAAEHPFELPPPSSAELLICYKNNGIGTGSCGPVLSEKYRFSDREFTFAFTLSAEEKEK
ncbi:MAG: beta-galactosidase small subunit [Clostridia bacterium]|nr:beta-galactosidase small subunit [Clostridia bacterium]